MILDALYHLARREHLVDDPDHERRRVDFFVHIARDGGFLRLIAARDDRGRASEITAPRSPKRQGRTPVPGFLFDNARYVLGLGSAGAEPGRNERCLEAFRALVADLARETGDAGASAVAAFLDRRAELLPTIITAHPKASWIGTEWLAFVLEGDGDRCVHDRPAVRAAWASRRRSEANAAVGPLVRCLVTGEIAVPARTHGSIKRIPRAQSSGATLVTFNADAFASHGLSQGENAPVSRAAAEGYVTALNWLLDPTPHRRFRFGIPIGDDAVTVIWTREEDPIVDAIVRLLDPSPAATGLDSAAAHVPSLADGPHDDTPFYAITLSGNAARIVVRDVLATTIASVKRNVRDYLSALRIAPADADAPSLSDLLRSLEGPSGHGLAPDLGARILSAALRGGPLPRELLGAALRRLRLPPDSLDERRLLRARSALIKATLLRLSQRRGASMEVPVSLDENNTEVPYLLGRLFAVLERLQAEAEGDHTAVLRDRSFGAASSTPSLVFPRLIQRSARSATRVGWTRGDHWVERIKARILDALPAGAFPRTLSLEAQGLFAIGYYHQRQRFFSRSSEGSDQHLLPRGSESAA